jgi:hypothetical protein
MNMCLRVLGANLAGLPMAARTSAWKYGLKVQEVRGEPDLLRKRVLVPLLASSGQQ